MNRARAMSLGGFALLLAVPCGAQEGPGGDRAPGPKSPTLALALSAAGTIVPAAIGYLTLTTGDSKDGELVLFAAGLYAGPSIGHFYANRPGPAVRGLIIRGLVVGASALALTQTGLCLESCESAEIIDELIVLAIGSGLTAASAIFDIVTAPRSARQYNESRAAGRAAEIGPRSLWIAPRLTRVGRAWGLGVALTF